MQDKEVCQIEEFSRNIAQELADEARADVLYIARRDFWEMCASRGPNYGASGDPLSAASWADSMLTEWDKRWNKENT